MTVQDFRASQVLVKFGTVRTWDAFDGHWDATPGLDWAHINPARGVYDFGAVDRYLDWAEARHAEVIYTFGRTPRWASDKPDRAGTYGPGECGAPARMGDWDDFVTALATHVHGRVKAWELWNEPNDPASFCASVGEMVAMARDASAILRRVDPGGVVLSPGVVSDGGPGWLDKFLREGGAGAVDAIAFHGYWSARAEDVVALVGRYRALAGGRPLWDTEASWAGRDGGRGGLTGGGARAAFLAKYELLQWSLGIQRFVWYSYDGQEIWGRLWNQEGGLREDGRAYAQVRDWMLGATMTGPCGEKDGIWRCGFRRQGWAGVVVWSAEGERDFQPDAGLRVLVDLGGRERRIDGLVRVGNQPVLMETGSRVGE